MSFKETMKKAGRKIKAFWNDHNKEIVYGVGAVAVTGGTIYGLIKLSEREDQKRLNYAIEEMNKDMQQFEDEIDEHTKWNKEWDDMATEFEVLTHQPLGSFKNGYTEEEGYVDPLDGNCFIIAGPISFYNESPDKLDFYVLDNEGWFHRMPDELRT